MLETITIFTRVPIQDLDAFIADPEVVLALTEDFGYDPTDVLNLASDPENIDPMHLFQIMEERYNGHGQTLSIEKEAPLLNHLLKTHYPGSLLETLANGGYPTPISNDHGPIKIFLPEPVQKIAQALQNLPVETLQAHANLDQISLPHTTLTKDQIITAPLWQLYEGLTTFFQNAARENQHILTSTQEP